MQFMILRRGDQASEAAGFPSAELVRAVPEARWLQPSANGLRLTRSGGAWHVSAEGPFDARELVAGYVFIEAASHDEAVQWAAQWPGADAEGGAELEVRLAGCPGGCVGFDVQVRQQGQADFQAEGEPTPATGLEAEFKPGVKPESELKSKLESKLESKPAPKPGLQHYAVLLRSDAASEADLEPPPSVIDTMNRANQAAIRAGIALAGEGLRASSRGARVAFSGGKASIVDGPFTEVKELIAGYWLLQTASIDAVVDWVKNYPFPHPPGMNIEVELRTVHTP